MTVGSLFAGIGGFDLGFERAGYDIKWQVELNPFCRAVLRKHWPHVRQYADVRRVGSHNLEPVDVLCGGFPCQDISFAGAGAGLGGARSGLWSEYLRVIRELRPRYVVVENVAALLGRGLGRVLGDLAASGYDAEWDCIPASAVGAPHRRDRVWIVAYPARAGNRDGSHGSGWLRFDLGRSVALRREEVADTDRPRLERWDGVDVCEGAGQWPARARGASVADCYREPIFGTAVTWPECHPWIIEPDVGRVAHGVPARVDRLKGLGNAIVPQIAEFIAHRIKDAEGVAA